MKSIRRMLAAASFALASTSVLAADAKFSLEKAEKNLKEAFGEQVEVTEVSSIADGQMAEVMLGDGSIFYMTPDLKHLVYREAMYRLDGENTVNLTNVRQNPRRAASLAKVSNAATVLFPAKGTQKALVNVFTDIDCGYCQLLHNEIPRLNELGVTVRYLAYPRAGVHDQQTGQLTTSYKKINYVWCNDDRPSAMTEMKTIQRDLGQLGRKVSAGDTASRGQYNQLQQRMATNLKASSDCGAPISEQFMLGGKLGVRGTPAIISQDGQLFPGYMPADELASRLGVL